MKRLWLAPLTLVAACSGSPDTVVPIHPTASTPPSVHIAHQPPSAKDIIAAVIASANVPLTTSPTCSNVGTELSDVTIGQYLAGFLAEMNVPDKKNWIETKAESTKSESGENISIYALTLYHEDGDDRWGWGVQFHVRSSDGLVLTNSFTCTGAG